MDHGQGRSVAPTGPILRPQTRYKGPRLQHPAPRAVLSQPYSGFAYSSAVTLDMSTDTTGSSPTTHASCPGGITYASPGPTSSSVPSSNLTCNRPETW